MIDRLAKLIKAKLEAASGPIKSAEIEQYFSVSGSEVRARIRDLRRAGMLITGDDNGYYIVKTYEEYQHLRASLRSRCMSMFTTIKAMDSEAVRLFQKSEPPVLELQLTK